MSQQRPLPKPAAGPQGQVLGRNLDLGISTGRRLHHRLSVRKGSSNPNGKRWRKSNWGSESLGEKPPAFFWHSARHGGCPSPRQGLWGGESLDTARSTISVGQVLRNAASARAAWCQNEPSPWVEKEDTLPRVTPHQLSWPPITAFLARVSSEQITNQTILCKGVMLNAKGKKLNRLS